jgi:adenosine deaminase
MIDAINRGITKARKQHAIEANIRIDLVRNEGPEKGMETLDSIQDNQENIVSVDLGGSEDEFPPAPFVGVFKRAKEMGLHLVAHAGEAAGPESIWDAIHYLNVERIGHAATAIKDARLMSYLKENSIAIEACPVSNVRTGVVSSINHHPVREFYDRGLMVTVNSDDPTLFNTDLNNELIQLNHHLNFSLEQIYQLTQNALNAAFLPEETKNSLHKEFEEKCETFIPS